MQQRKKNKIKGDNNVNVQQAKRSSRLGWIEHHLKDLKAKKQPFIKDWLIADIVKKYGITRRLATEDLKTIMDYMK